MTEGAAPGPWPDGSTFLGGGINGAVCFESLGCALAVLPATVVAVSAEVRPKGCRKAASGAPDLPYANGAARRHSLSNCRQFLPRNGA